MQSQADCKQPSKWHTRFFYKQQFYKQCQAEISKKQAKTNQHPEAENWKLKIIRFLHPHYHLKIIGDVLKNVQKRSASFLMLYDIDHIVTTWIDLGLEMDTNILNIKCVSV